MNWGTARRLLHLPAKQSAPIARPLQLPPSDPLAAVRARSMCVVSGKGGTGKSTLTASLAASLERHGRVLLVDADLGVGNAHLFCDLQPKRTLADVVRGECSAREAVVPVRGQLDLLAGGSGCLGVASLDREQLQLLGKGLYSLEERYRSILIDGAAGLSSQTLQLAAAADIVLVVTTPDVTAMTDAYALIKVLCAERPGLVPYLVVNRVFDASEGHAAAERMRAVARRFLDVEIRLLGLLPEDRSAYRCTQRRQPVVLGEPDEPLGLALADLAQRLQKELDHLHPHGVGRVLCHRLGRDGLAESESCGA